MRNLNIKSDEAYELAHFVAARTGKSMTATIIDLLKREKRSLTKDELVEKWTRIAEENRRNLDPKWLNWDYDADLYDEFGLPNSISVIASLTHSQRKRENPSCSRATTSRRLISNLR
jgi:hypothetical protein